MKVLFLGTDAFGGRGGIANYNRCLIRALDRSESVSEVQVLLRSVVDPPGALPGKAHLDLAAAGGKVAFIRRALAAARKWPDLIVCGHVNLGPLAGWVSRISGAPFVTQVHGVDVWQPPKSALRRAALGRAKQVWSVSQFTVNRMRQWCSVPEERFRVMPNMIDLEAHHPEPRNERLAERYGLVGKKVLMTLARLDARERYKGIDEVLEALPRLRQEDPSLTYLIAGAGDDQERLRAKASQLGLSEAVVFTGYLPDGEKLDTLRLADAFVMPGYGEGFGIVYLEALACGVNVVGSRLDASAEALGQGELGAVVDPRDQDDLVAGIRAALQAGPPERSLLETYSWDSFARRVDEAAQEWRQRIATT